jgi:hypothetical protein
MLHDVEAVLSVPAALTIVDRECAVTDNRMKRCPEAGGVEAVDSDDLPGELAAGAKASDIAFESEVLAGGDLMPDAGSNHRIDPFEVV